MTPGVLSCLFGFQLVDCRGDLLRQPHQLLVKIHSYSPLQPAALRTAFCNNTRVPRHTLSAKIRRYKTSDCCQWRRRSLRKDFSCAGHRNCRPAKSHTAASNGRIRRSASASFATARCAQKHRTQLSCPVRCGCKWRGRGGIALSRVPARDDEHDRWLRKATQPQASEPRMSRPARAGIPRTCR